MKNHTPKPSALRIAKRVFAVLVALFMLLFLGRFLYNMTAAEQNQFADNSSFLNYLDLSSSASNLIVNNIATNRLMAPEVGNAAAVAALDQKYARVANLAAQSADFDKDLAQAKAALEEHQGIMQAENSSGLPGERAIFLTIGVRPEAFDTLREALGKIGKATLADVSTTDKTSEYRQLLAEKESLTRRLERYEALKQQGGSLQDQLKLEAEIMNIDEQLQKKLVDLGEYGDEQGLSTINFSLSENKPASVAQKTGRALTSALSWAVLVFLAAVGVAIMIVLAALAFAAVWVSIKKRLAQAEEAEEPEEESN